MSVWQKIAEYYGFAGRHDFSGVRGGLRRPLTKRDGQFPYDRETFYGTPQAYDRGSNKGRDQGPHPIVPKDTNHSIWDDMEPEVSEALGTQGTSPRAQSGDGSGRTLPGTTGPWAHAPFDDAVSDEELDAAGDDQQVSSKMPVGQKQFGMGMQKRKMGQRESKMGVWQTIAEAYVSLKDTPEGQMSLSTGVRDAELEVLQREFDEASAATEQQLSQMEDADVVKFLVDLDPDHAAQSLGTDVGKEKLMSTYRSWADRVKSPPRDQELDGR